MKAADLDVAASGYCEASEAQPISDNRGDIFVIAC